jgi:DNA-binding MarR family transcriptional regulator
MNIPDLKLDPHWHQPARLQIATVLANAGKAEFAKLREITEVSDSVMSKHLSALSEAGYVRITASPVNGRSRKWVSFTGKGRKAFAAHMAALQALVAIAEQASAQ